MEFLTDIYSLAMLVGAVILTAAFVVAVYWFVSQKKSEQIMYWAQIVVNSIQQQMQLVDGPRKKELAMIALRKIRDQIGAKASDAQLEMLIEANVHLMKNLAKALPGEVDDKLIEALTAGILKEEAQG